MYPEGFGQVDGSTTRAVTKEMAARREIRYLGLHQRVSGLRARERMRIHRLLLCCVQNLSDAGALPTNLDFERYIRYTTSSPSTIPMSHLKHWIYKSSK